MAQEVLANLPHSSALFAHTLVTKGALNILKQFVLLKILLTMSSDYNLGGKKHEILVASSKAT